MHEPPASNTQRKWELRRHYRLLRRRLLAGCEAGVQASLAAALPAILATAGRRRRLGLYWPLEGEVDLRPVLSSGALAPERLALPAIADGVLRFRPWQAGSELHPDACGIPAPAGSAGDLDPSDLALLLVPALAADRQGLRLGYGGGWYDRLRAQEAWRAVPALAVLPQGCLLPSLPRDPWDVPLDGWLTEAGVRWLRRAGDEA